MRLCMFHPNDNPLERGWVCRVDGDRVLHLAAQTLQSFFLGGSGAREHAEYPLADVTFLVPVQPPTVRVFSAPDAFRFTNATALVGPNVPIAGTALTACARVAAVIGAEGGIGGFSALLEWQDLTESPSVKQSDFGLVLGPVVVTPDEVDPDSVVIRLDTQSQREEAPPTEFGWADAIALAARRTVLRPGDVIAGPSVATLTDIHEGVRLEIEGIGVLDCPLG
ncbi:MAG: fumarylacetoacetate hydrolase family protein [Thermoleophilia bacterium]|nr:fumarylacetoacetate hydrolase family protein [Thermoleophilia bacterium]